MLQSLYIRNYVLIDRLEMQFNGGFTTLTGETGAGKSILMGALGLILGQRVDTTVLKLKDAKCIVEGTFKPGEGIRQLFEMHDLDFEELSTIRREISPGGKSRAFINDSPVNLPLLKEVGNRLVDIHSQHQSLQLGDHLYQMEVLNYLGNTEEDLQSYKKDFHIYKELDEEIGRIRVEAAKLREDLDYMEFQYNELLSAKLVEGELDELESEFQRAEHAEEIGTALGLSSDLLKQESSGVLDQLMEILNQLRKVSKVYDPAAVIAGRLESSYIEIKDLSSELEGLAGKADLDPGRLEQLRERIDLLYGLMQKHRMKRVEELIEMQNQLEQKIEACSFSDEKITGLERQRQSLEDNLLKIASNLHNKRSEAGAFMQSKVEKQLKELGIAHARFQVDVAERGELDAFGSDEVRFLFSANPQMGLEEISRVASGGEVSRLMLCIKALVSDQKGMPTLIFDEIDTGVSGEIAEKFGNIMAELAGGRQVIAITHLPQVASMGTEHFTVFKEESESASYTRIRKLEQDERIEEIARMLSGESVTGEALSNARVLLKV